NQFVKQLGLLGLDPFRMLVVDLMHECELGTWKASFTHLIRLLNALPGGTQLVPMFGVGVIQKFADNMSEMKRLAACDFEDILQVLCYLSTLHSLTRPPVCHSSV
ncbi:hypothetical protein BDR06DRAFT_879631, partial [Suillus hirtellus]